MSRRTRAKTPPIDAAALAAFIREADPEAITRLERALDVTATRRRLETSLKAFTIAGWEQLEPARPLIWNWHLDTLCGYLEAFRARRFRRLILNVPPGTMKSLLASVFFPAWIWTTDTAHRFVCGANEDTLATRDGLKMRRLVTSDWYRGLWGDRVLLTADQDEKTYFENTATGFRQSLGVNARVTGKRGDTLIWDDAHDAKQANSDAHRLGVISSWDDAWSSRLNDPNASGVLFIMQRTHYEDIVGHVIKKTEQKWKRVAIPMRYDREVTFDAGADLGRPELNDPRTEEGELLFPARFNEETVRNMETDLGPYGTAGQLQQRPSPKGGGELRREWFRRYRRQPVGCNTVILVDPAGERRPGASGANRKKDYTAILVVGMGHDKNFYLLDGYRDRLNLRERTRLLFELHRKWEPLGVGYERYGKDSDIAHIEERMEDEQYRFVITPLGGSLKKEDRIRRLIPDLAAARWWFPEQMYRTGTDGKTVDVMQEVIEQEVLPFPVGSRDDFIDALSRIKDPEMQEFIKWPDQRVVPIETKPRRASGGAQSWQAN